MPGEVDARIQTLGFELPMPSEPGGSYVPYHFAGNLLFLTGQLCHWNGERLFVGRLGKELAVEVEGVIEVDAP